MLLEYGRESAGSSTPTRVTINRVEVTCRQNDPVLEKDYPVIPANMPVEGESARVECALGQAEAGETGPAILSSNNRPRHCR